MTVTDYIFGFSSWFQFSKFDFSNFHIFTQLCFMARNITDHDHQNPQKISSPLKLHVNGFHFTGGLAVCWGMVELWGWCSNVKTLKQNHSLDTQTNHNCSALHM